MDSTELLNEIKTQLELLKHKGYDKNSFKSGYLLGYAKALQLLQTDVVGQSEQLKALEDLKQWCFETCQPLEEERLHEILKRL